MSFNMKTIASMGAFALEMLGVEAGLTLAIHSSLEKVAQKVEKTAKDEIGKYQKEIGPFNAWEELAESTKEDRVSKGFTENDPLLRTGQLRDSISHKTHGLEAHIGSTSEIMVWQELGTPKIPPRPVLGPAVEHNIESLKKIVGGAVVSRLTGKSGIDYLESI